MGTNLDYLKLDNLFKKKKTQDYLKRKNGFYPEYNELVKKWSVDWTGVIVPAKEIKKGELVSKVEVTMQMYDATERVKAIKQKESEAIVKDKANEHNVKKTFNK